MKRGAASGATAIATVNGRPIAREKMIDLLIRARGAEVLEQLVVLEAAEGLAAQRGLTVHDADVESEYEGALRDLAGRGQTSGTFDHAAAEAILTSVLAQRHVSPEEFKLGMRRNALLRKLAGEEQVVTDAQVAAEFTRQYGPRARVTVAPVRSLADATQLRGRLSSQDRFIEGLQTLGPFSAEHEDVPAIIRRAAFQLSPGQVSETLQLESGWILVRVDEQLPGQDQVSLASERAGLEAAVKGRHAQSAMANLYERLFREAQIKIQDATLRESFKAAYPQR